MNLATARGFTKSRRGITLIDANEEAAAPTGIDGDGVAIVGAALLYNFKAAQSELKYAYGALRKR